MEHSILLSSDVEGNTTEWETLLGEVIPAALEAEGVSLPCEINVLLTDDAGIQAINLAERGVDAPTGRGTSPLRPTPTPAPTWSPWGTWC